MKLSSKWFWIGLIIVVILLIVGYLYYKGVIHTSWQWLSVILVGLAAPFQLVSSMLGTNKKLNQILTKSQARQQDEIQHREIFDKVIKEKEMKIQELEAQVDKMQDKIDTLELEYKKTDKNIMAETDVDELQNQFMDLYGDEE